MIIPRQSNSRFWGRRHDKNNFSSISCEVITTIVEGGFRINNNGEIVATYEDDI